MKMSNSSTMIGSGSSTSSVSAPMIGDEYVMIKKSDFAKVSDSKAHDFAKKLPTTGEQKTNETETLAAPMLRMTSKVHNSLGTIKTQLAYDFDIVPSTSSAFSLAVAMTATNDTAFTGYWKNLFRLYAIDSADLVLDFREYCNLTGVSDKLSPIVWAFDQFDDSKTITYGILTDYQSARQCPWSVSKPIVHFKVPQSIMKVTPWAVITSPGGASPIVSEWMSTTYTANAVAKGTIALASYAPFCIGTAGRIIHCRLLLNVRFSNKYGGL